MAGCDGSGWDNDDRETRGKVGVKAREGATKEGVGGRERRQGTPELLTGKEQWQCGWSRGVGRDPGREDHRKDRTGRGGDRDDRGRRQREGAAT